MSVASPAAKTELSVSQGNDQDWVVRLGGDWRTRPGLPGIEELETKLAESPAARGLRFETSALGPWNSGLLAFLLKCLQLCEAHGIPFRAETLPEGVQKLLRLSNAVPEKKDAQRASGSKPFVTRVGEISLQQWQGVKEMLRFLGENVLALSRLLRGRAQFRWSDAWVFMQECGPEALGIVALINFLVGLILAFVGAVQLVQFGASIYVADLVAIATVREMGCIMTGIIICGRTGASYAAQLGTMKVNEELDALTTFGISPTEFLVLPRVVALLLMMPLLCVFADLIAILGGYVAAMGTLDITSTEYLDRTIEAIQLKSFLLGIFKGSFFGFLVALTGCLRGMQCGSNAAAVGQATTAAVVAGITAIIAADGIFAVICNALNL